MDTTEKTRGSDGRVGKGVMKHTMGTGYLAQQVTTKRVKQEAERAADWFLIHFPKATVTLTAELEDGTRIEVTRGVLKSDQSG
jgi:hypothetical protein